MALPDPLRVKISSETAGYLSLTPVVVQSMPLVEVLERIAAHFGPDAARAREVLRRGSLVSGASRLRWEPLETTHEEVAAALARLPGPEPSRPLDAARCIRLVLAGPADRIELDRATAARKRLLRARSFWDDLLRMLPACQPEYVGYLYRERADHYRVPLAPEQRAALRDACRLLAYSLHTTSFECVELIVARE